MDRYVPLRKLKAASAKLCAGWMAYGRKHPSAKPNDPRSLAAAIREKPATHVPLCAVSVQVDLAVNAQTYRFVTKAERTRYQRDYCRLAATYMQPNSIAIDNARLAAEHPGLFAPFCASMVQDGAGPAVLAVVHPAQDAEDHAPGVPPGARARRHPLRLGRAHQRPDRQRPLRRHPPTSRPLGPHEPQRNGSARCSASSGALGWS